MPWDPDRLLGSLAFFVSSNVSPDNLPKHLTILSETDNHFSYFKSSLILQSKARRLLVWSSNKTNWQCFSIIHVWTTWGCLTPHRSFFSLAIYHIWSSHNIQSFSYIYQYSAKAGNLSQSFILILLLLLVGIHTPAKSVRTYLVPYGCYAFNLLVYSSCKWRLKIV